MLRVIREIQPRFVVGENVAGLLSWNNGMVFHEIITDLENDGYETQAFVIPACATNAPHRRDRIFFVAYSLNCGYSAERGKETETDGIQSKIGKAMDTREFNGTSVSRITAHSNNSRTNEQMQFNGKRKENDEQWRGQSQSQYWENGINGITTYTDNGSESRSLKNYMSHHQMLPTPMAQNRETTLEKTLERKEKYGGEKRAMYLENYAVMGLLPTPRVKGHGNSHQRIEDGKIDDLTTMAKRGMLPTPCQRDYKGGLSQNSLSGNKKAGKFGETVPDFVKRTTGNNSQLNPLFVAEMMGFPIDWTVLPFQNGETNQLRDTEMQ